LRTTVASEVHLPGGSDLRDPASFDFDVAGSLVGALRVEVDDADVRQHDRRISIRAHRALPGLCGGLNGADEALR
jgi:hypothetical protein